MPGVSALPDSFKNIQGNPYEKCRRRVGILCPSEQARFMVRCLEMRSTNSARVLDLHEANKSLSLELQELLRVATDLYTVPPCQAQTLRRQRAIVD